MTPYAAHCKVRRPSRGVAWLQAIAGTQCRLMADCRRAGDASGPVAIESAMRDKRLLQTSSGPVAAGDGSNVSDPKRSVRLREDRRFTKSSSGGRNRPPQTTFAIAGFEEAW